MSDTPHACLFRRTVFSCREHMALAPSHSPDRGDRSRHLRKFSGRSTRHDFAGLVSCIEETPITTTNCISMASLLRFRLRLRVGTTGLSVPGSDRAASPSRSFLAIGLAGSHNSNKLPSFCQRRSGLSGASRLHFIAMI